MRPRHSWISQTSTSTATLISTSSTRAWALRENITVYDAMYVVLAESLDAPFLTCDGPLARAPGHRAHIELVR